MTNKENILLFSLSSNKELARDVASELEIELSPCNITHFADGEIFAKPLVDVTNKSVYVIQSTSKPVDEHLLEIFIFVDALRNAKAREINLVIPYFGYSRQDRIINPGDPVTTKMISKLFETVGATRVIALDLHSHHMKDFFKIPVINLLPTKLFGSYVNRKIKQFGEINENVTLVAPDKGSVNRMEELAKEIPGCSLAYLSKVRPEPNQAVIEGINGDVNNKFCVIYDDIIDTGGTIISALAMLKKHGAKELMVLASHGVLSNNAVDKLFNAGIKSLVVSNSISDVDIRVHVVSIASLIADQIKILEGIK